MSRYKKFTDDQVVELLSNYLIDAWSFSKVATFSRNEKEFEMRYLYNEKGKSSATSIGGQAYHAAIELFFNRMMAGGIADIVEMEQAAFSLIDDVRADTWKIQKTRPTVQECITAAMKSSTSGITNFLKEVETYTTEIKTVIAVELKLMEWLTINGVDIPLPCNMITDLVIETFDGKKVIIDHKLKSAFTDDNEIRFTIGKQAITYVKGYEACTGNRIDEVWFVENKTSKNKDGSPQLRLHKVVMDDSTRRLYEAMLYEPLKRMIEAVNNPDYVYLINDNDNFCDTAEIYEFWAKTMLAEISDFNIPDSKKEIIEKRLRKIRDASIATVSPTILRNFKKFTAQFIPYDLSNKDMTHQEKIEHVLRSFNIITNIKHTFEGYSSSSYLLEMGAGTSISAINKYRLDIANALNVSNVRIQKDLMVYEGKSYLTIESSKKGSAILAWDQSKLQGFKIPIGIDNFQETVYWNLDNHSTSHMLVCGATGSGKSVLIKSTIEYARVAGINEIIIFDPKHEFIHYRKNGIIVVNDIEDIELQMMLLVEDMENRVKSGTAHKTLIIFDEFADAVANSRKGNELKNYGEEVIGMFANGLSKTKRVVKSTDRSLEENLRVILQKGRSSGFRIVAATQRASTKVITGDAKVNFPVQVCFRVPKEIDSMVVIDEVGAESLNGRGDGLIKSPEYLGVIRFQGFYTE